MDSLSLSGEMAPPFTWVAAAPAFDAMLESLSKANRFAIDIEADSLYHYFEKVCLIQMSTDSATFVLDPLALSSLQRLSPLMSDPAFEKVFHAASYDVFCLRRDFGFTFANIFDTHEAAQLLGYEQLGLSFLLERLLEITHSKRRQRDDWSRRPLEPEQLTYAAMDTHHLLRVRDILEAQLRERSRLSWALEEFEAAANAEPPEREFDPEGFRRIKGNRNLSPQKLGALRALYVLRDRCAREMDLPPFKVINNSVLLDLAQRPPQAARELFQRPGESRRVARKFGSEIFRSIQAARLQEPAPADVPVRNHWRPPAVEEKLLLEHLKRWRQNKAEELGLHVGVVFPGSFLESISLSPPADLDAFAMINGMRRWRVEQFGPEILGIIRNTRPKEIDTSDSAA
jgi:ribonuclease D